MLPARSINFKEFICALSVTSRGSTYEKLQCTRAGAARVPGTWTAQGRGALSCAAARPAGAFQLYDVDGNGVVTRAEMLEIVRAVYKMIGNAVALSPDEDTPEKRVDKIFAAMDRRGSGVLSLEDFCAGADNDPAVLQALSLYDGLV